MTAQAVPVTGPEPADDPYDVRFSRSATRLLRDFNQAGVLGAADVHVADCIGRLGGESDDSVLLAAALAVRAVRQGSVCVALAAAPDTVSPDDESRVGVADLPWPDPEEWLARCTASPLVAVGSGQGARGGPGRPLRMVHGLLYLDRYWREEELVRVELDARAGRTVPGVDEQRLRSALGSVFNAAAPDRQRLAVAMSALRSVSVLAGGPGTGKTTTVARLIAVLRSVHGPGLRVALAAPTGKAAARLQEVIDQEAEESVLDLGAAKASTLHRLLGRRPGSRSRFRHDRHNRLPYDVVVVDETSMVSLSMMARLLEAVRPEAQLVLVGDPDQLASVEAGAVLGDLVERPALATSRVPPGLLAVARADLDFDQESSGAPSGALRNGVVRLGGAYRFGGAIRDLAEAVRSGSPDRVEEVVRRGDDAVELVEVDAGARPFAAALDPLRADVVAAAAGLVGAARAGEVDDALGLLGQHRLLCAHRRGPYGVARWTAEIEGWLAAEIDAYETDGEWYVGRPLLVSANDYDVRLYNGDTGVVVRHRDRGVVAAFGRPGAAVLLSPRRLSSVRTVHTTTVHRAQGSQFERVSLLLPPMDSPLLTRELFYTAVTRAQRKVRIVGSVDAVRRAVSRPIVRASGLRLRTGPA